MKNIIITFLSIFSTFQLSGQNLSYSQLINIAELKITEEKYDEALNSYINASEKTELHATDIHNTLICAILIKDEKHIRLFGKQLSTKGLPGRYFLEKSVFKDLISQTYWQEYADQSQKIYQHLLTKYQETIAIIDSVILFDQKINDEMQKLISIYRGRHDTLRAYEKTRMENSRYLAEYFTNHIFPGENLIYYYLKNDTTLALRPHFDAVIIHSYQGWYLSDTFFTPVLLKGLQQKLIKPETFANLQDNGNTNMDSRTYYGTVHMFIKEDDSFYAQPFYYGNLSIRRQINEKRIQIGLLPLEDEIQKIKYYDSKGKNLGFIFHESYNVYINFGVEDSYIKI